MLLSPTQHLPYRKKSVINILEEQGGEYGDDSEEGSIHPDKNGYAIHMENVNRQSHESILSPNEAICRQASTDDQDTLSTRNMEYPIYLAIRNRDIDALKLEAENNPSSISQKNCLGKTPLHVAVSDGWQEGIDELLNLEASPNTLSEKIKMNSKQLADGFLIQSPFHKAVRNGDMIIVKSFMNHNPDLRMLDGQGASVIHIAAEAQSIPLLKLFIEENECKDFIYANDNAGNNIIHAAMTKKENISEAQVLETVKFILTTGLNIHSQNMDGKTPIYCAAKSGYSSVIKLLLKHSTDPTVVAKSGRNVLHAACQSGCAASLSSLINTGKLYNFVTSEDEDGCSPFHLAIKSGSVECCKVLLLNGDHLANVDRDGISRCSLILSHLASAKQLLQDIFDSHVHISDKTRYDPDFYIEYDFSVFTNNESENMQSSIIYDLVNSKQESFLSHPLVETFLNMKWQRSKYIFSFKVITFFVYLILHTVYLTLTFGASTMKWYYNSVNLHVMQSLHLFMFLLILIPDTIYFFFNARKYLLHLETYTQLIALVSASYVVFSPHIATHKSNLLIDKHIAAISAFMSWVEFMMLMGRFPIKQFPSLGIYIMMLTQVAKSFIKFLVAFSSLLIGFSVSFYILFPEVPSFDTFPRSFVKTLMMMIDGIDYWALLKPENPENPDTVTANIITFPGKETGNSESPLSEIFTESVQTAFLLLYAFLVSILMANLLIGLAINDMEELSRQGKIRRLSKQATYQLTYEHMSNIFIKLRFFPKFFKFILAKQSNINLQKRIYPNKFKRKNLNADQLEIIQNAIDLKTDDQDDDTVEDLTKMFTKFRLKYKKDQKNIQELLKNISEELINFKMMKSQTDEMQMVLNELKK
ncbi:unnamed protein product [Meganyctiphanes norvegica]|uniref:Ion transport domain-containing protein n=1 Tax=Meganyctiphanes norvegica TaxID=48144 RepID=A0AAV2RL85_MEGNR